MAKVSFSSIEGRVSFETSAQVSARIMAEAEKATSDAEKLAIMKRGFEEMAEAEKNKTKIFDLVERLNLLGVSDGNVSGAWDFLLKFYDIQRAREVFRDWLVQLSDDTKRIVKDDSGKWVADTSRVYYSVLSGSENKTASSEAATASNMTEETTAAASASETVNQ